MGIRSFQLAILTSILLASTWASANPCVPSPDITNLPLQTCSIGNVTYSFTDEVVQYTYQDLMTGVSFSPPAPFKVSFTPDTSTGGFILGGLLKADPAGSGYLFVDEYAELDFTFTVNVDIKNGLLPITSIGASLSGYSATSSGVPANSYANIDGRFGFFSNNTYDSSGNFVNCDSALPAVASLNGTLITNRPFSTHSCNGGAVAGEGIATIDVNASGSGVASIDPEEFVVNPPANFGTAVPEPATFALLVPGLLALGATVRRKRAAK